MGDHVYDLPSCRISDRLENVSSHLKLFSNRLVTQIYMKPFGYTKFFFAFFKIICGLNKGEQNLIKNTTIKTSVGNKMFYFVDWNRVSFYTKNIVAIMQVKID